MRSIVLLAIFLLLTPSGLVLPRVFKTLANDLDRLFVHNKLVDVKELGISFIARFDHLIKPNLHLVIDLLRNEE